ncbi:hypothetical protein A9F13_03g01221 [Clavispora lusitaniae]|uniref:Uncharacterized protein n=1 Tax=Clavispora lusitaniae TaxID=36911 RepID=A0AA91T3A3_CLALS|nr:hypothetical protein A9F13_03g01221 [Clavispora lusitaniae]
MSDKRALESWILGNLGVGKWKETGRCEKAGNICSVPSNETPAFSSRPKVGSESGESRALFSALFRPTSHAVRGDNSALSQASG